MPTSATTRMVENERPAVIFQRPQRDSFRDNPFNGTTWGQDGWPDDTGNALDLTAEAIGSYPAPFANLAALKADGTYGDGFLAYNAGANFTTGQFVILNDNTKAHYNTAAWVAGAAA